MEQEARMTHQSLLAFEELEQQSQHNIVAMTPSSTREEKNERVEWDFITLNKQLPEVLQNKLILFQKSQDGYKWTLHYKNGVFGSLVDIVGEILVEIDKLPSKSNIKYYSIGTPQTGGIQVDHNIIQILASGFDLCKKNVPHTIFMTPTLQSTSSNTWLTDNHTEMLRLILDQKRVQLPAHTNMQLPKSTVILNTFFYTKFENNKAEALSWLSVHFNQHNLLFEHGCSVEELLLPLNLNNTHWILGIINIKHHCFFTMNPYRPKDPTAEELDKVRVITDELGKEYGFPEFSVRAPDFVQFLPVQHCRDTINCGVYISMYMAIYAFGSSAQTFIGKFLPKPIDECRFLLLAWLLKGEVFFPCIMP
jgi:hypothetical protein